MAGLEPTSPVPKTDMLTNYTTPLRSSCFKFITPTPTLFFFFVTRQRYIFLIKTHICIHNTYVKKKKQANFPLFKNIPSRIRA